MVLSLAFILALVFSAIVLLIGIVIFGEIAEAMELTLPTQGTVLPPLQAISQGNLTANNEWQLREQVIDGTTTIDCVYAIKNGLTTFPNPPTPIGSSRGWCHVFKVFDKADIIGKDLVVEWRGGQATSGFPDEGAICVLDGVFDRNNATQFPNNNAIAAGCGVLSPVILHVITQDFFFFSGIDTITMTLAGSTKDQITIFVMFKDSSGSASISMIIPEISILDLAKWDWDFPTAGAPATVSITRTIAHTPQDSGVTNAVLTNLLPLILSESDQQQVDTFNNAQVIGFTVIGILPVALFFALFSIFSGRIE